MLRHPRTPLLVAVAVLVSSSFPPSLARAQSGVAITPDERTHLVNKDLAGARWTISLNLALETPNGETQPRKIVTNATGNVYREGEPVSFVVCQVAPGSTGSLDDPSSVFRFSCDDASACTSNALACSQSDWGLVSRDVELPATFFLPGSANPAAAARSAAAATPLQEAPTRGVSLSYDGLTYLVSKDIDEQRWSITVNLTPRVSDEGGVRKELASVTGNVFNRDGSPPQFVYCQETEASEGDLGDAASTFRFRCLGTIACTRSVPSECAAEWTLLAESLELPASFLLPDGGSGLPRSDPEIIVIGRTSDPPSIATEDFTPVAGAASASAKGGACSGACRANRIGECSDVPGTIIQGANERCFCLVEDVPASCITCGSGSVSGQCGRPCGYPVGSSTARGVCLPFDALSSDCLCNAVGASGVGRPTACGGPLGAPCKQPGQCCVDDPSDGCDPGSGDTQCGGLCAGIEGCDPVTQECGFCSDPCGNGAREGIEQCDGTDLASQTCESRGLGSGQLACSADCTFDTSACGGCGNGRIDPGEECDGQDLGGKTCESLGLPPGDLACSSSCTLALQGCVGSCTTEASCLEASVGPNGSCLFRDLCPSGQVCACPGGGDGCGEEQLACVPTAPTCADLDGCWIGTYENPGQGGGAAGWDLEQTGTSLAGSGWADGVPPTTISGSVTCGGSIEFGFTGNGVDGFFSGSLAGDCVTGTAEGCVDGVGCDSAVFSLCRC